MTDDEPSSSKAHIELHLVTDKQQGTSSKVQDEIGPADVSEGEEQTPKRPPNKLSLDGVGNSRDLRSSVSFHTKQCTLAEEKLNKFADLQAAQPQSDRSGSCDCNNDILTKRVELPYHKVTVQEFFTLSGFGKFQFLHVVCFIFIFIRDGAEVILAALIKPELSCYWSLTTTEGALIPIAPALSYALGSQVIGILADKFGRKKCMQWSIGLTLAFDVGSSFSQNYLVFIILRVLAALFLGGAFGTMLTMWTEICPKSKRFLSLFYFSLFWTTGTVFVVAEAWFLDWNDRLDWPLFLIIISLPTAFAFFFSFWTFETPNYYVVSGNIDKAVKMIKDVIELNQMEPASYDILCEGTYYDRGAIITLFQLPYVKVTVCFMLLSFGVGYTFGGWTVLLSYLFTNNYCTNVEFYQWTSMFCKSLTNEAYLMILIASLGGYPGYIVAYHVSKKIGPMNYVSVAYFFAFYFFVVLNWCFWYYLYYFELFITRALLGGGYLMLWLYTPVYYHTQVRAVGVGLGICSLKIGTASAAAIISYFDMSYKFYSFAGCCLLVTFVAVALSEPMIKQKLFEKTDNVLEIQDFEELYKHHHIPHSDIDWHIRKEETKKKKKPSVPYNTFKQHKNWKPEDDSPSIDFNWVDGTPTPSSMTSNTNSTNYMFSVKGSSSTSTPELPISAFRNRELYLETYDTATKPTFAFDRSKYPTQTKRKYPKRLYNIRPASIDLSTASKYELTPHPVRSADNSPDPAAAHRQRVIRLKPAVKPPVVERTPSPVYQNTEPANTDPTTTAKKMKRRKKKDKD